MEDTPDDVESYQSELSKKVREGGGCAETWDALTDLRGDLNDRRTVMKGLLGLVGGILGSGVASASDGVEDGGVRVDTLSGRRREQILSRALSDVQYTKLIEALEKDGYRGSSIEKKRLLSKTHQCREILARFGRPQAGRRGNREHRRLPGWWSGVESRCFYP